MVHPAMDAADRLAEHGLRAAVLNARFVKPLDAEAIVALAKRCRALVCVEEHGARGGFGAAVLEALAEAGVRLPTRCLAVPDQVVEHGDPGAQRAAFGLDPAGIERAAQELLEGTRS